MFLSYNKYVQPFLWVCLMAAARHLHHPHGLHHCQTNPKLESQTVAGGSKSSISLISQLWLSKRNGDVKSLNRVFLSQGSFVCD